MSSFRNAGAVVALALVLTGGTSRPAAGQEIHEGPLPADARPVFGSNFDDSPAWEGFWETKNTFQKSPGAARAPRDLSLSASLSGTGLPEALGRDYDFSRLKANRYLGFAYYVEDVSAVTVSFFNASKQALMTAQVSPPKQKQWVHVWFNLLKNLQGGEPFPQQVELGDRLTHATLRAIPSGPKPVFILDNVQLFDRPEEKVEPPPRQVLPAAAVNRVRARLVLETAATLGPEDVALPRFPQGKEIAVTFVYDAPHEPDESIEEAKILARHGWKGTWLLRGNYPSAARMIPELEKLGIEIGALPRSVHEMNQLSYPENLDEAMSARRSLEPSVKAGSILSFEVPDSHRGGYVPFWVGAFSMRAVRDAGFLVQNGWGKYCYLPWLDPPYPQWGGDISCAMIQLYARRPGPSEPVHLFFGRPHESYGFEENYSQPLNGAREIYGKINEFGYSGANMPRQFDRLLDYTRRWDLGKVIVLKTLGIPERAVFEEVVKAHAGKPDLWFATLGEIATYEYLRSRCRVVPVAPAKQAREVEIDIEMADVQPAWVRQPLTVEVRRKLSKVSIEGQEVPVRGGTFEVPRTCFLRKPLKAELTPSRKEITLPDKVELALTVENSDPAPRSFEVEWTVPETWGWKIRPLEGAGKIALEEGQSRKLRYELEATAAAGFGLWPVTARLKVETSNGVRHQYVGADLVVAPRLFVKTRPWLPAFIRPKGRMKVRVYVSRDVKSDPLPYGAFEGQQLDRFIYKGAASPRKGKLRVKETAGFKITPSEAALDLPDKGSAKLDFVIENTAPPADPQQPLIFQPEIELDGIGLVKTAMDPVRVYVDPGLEYKPLDKRGLVLYAPFDGNAEPKTVLDPKSAGQTWGPVVLYGQRGGAPDFVEGKKGQALANAQAMYGPEKNFNAFESSILFWWKLPGGGDGQKVDIGGTEYNVMRALSTLSLGRMYPLWAYYNDGHLHFSRGSFAEEFRNVKAKWPTDDKWHHVAVTWDYFAKSMKMHVDGKRVDEEKSPGEWVTESPQLARQIYDFPGWKDYYKGEYGGMPPGDPYIFHIGVIALSGHAGEREKVPYMDELYIFDRALTEKEIQEHIKGGH